MRSNGSRAAVARLFARHISTPAQALGEISLRRPLLSVLIKQPTNPSLAGEPGKKLPYTVQVELPPLPAGAKAEPAEGEEPEEAEAAEATEAAPKPTGPRYKEEAVLHASHAASLWPAMMAMLCRAANDHRGGEAGGTSRVDRQ